MRLTISVLLLLCFAAASTKADVLTLNDASITNDGGAGQNLDEQHQQQQRLLQNDEEYHDIIFFNGIVFNDIGQPLEGAQVQIWQTDPFGHYNHPVFLQSNNYPTLMKEFQYYGTSTTNADGEYQFITYRPGRYPSRPMSHIHYKVLYNGSVLLTSQFYFVDEGHTEFSNKLQLQLFPFSANTTSLTLPNEEEEEEESSTTSTSVHRYGNDTASSNDVKELCSQSQSQQSQHCYQTSKNIVVNLNLGGPREDLTPFQQEGPFYPMVDFFHLGSNLIQGSITVVDNIENEDNIVENGDSTSTNNNNNDVAGNSITSSASEAFKVKTRFWKGQKIDGSLALIGTSILSVLVVSLFNAL